MKISETVRQIFEQRGSAAYFGEAVSMLEHSLQTAHFAMRARSPDTLVVAALLHDIGHLIEAVPADIADWHTDAHHEEKGATWLSQYFGPEISDPVRLHVPAKRYLCAIDAQYAVSLSPASIATLKLQGGPMSVDEATAFEREPGFRDAVMIRRWDDAGKVAGLKTENLTHYLDLVDRLGNP